MKNVEAVEIITLVDRLESLNEVAEDSWPLALELLQKVVFAEEAQVIRVLLAA